MKVTLAVERSKLVQAQQIMANMRNNAEALLQLWEECDNNEYGTYDINTMLSDALLRNYRRYFTHSFDDLVADMREWINPVIQEIDDSLNTPQEGGQG